MANEKRLIMTEQEAIAKAEQELSTSRYIAECARSPGMRAIHDKRCAWLSVLVRLAKKALNVDAVEMVHGRYVPRPYHKFNSEGRLIKYCDFYYCSECRTERPIVPPYNYCPNCGAKMDGDGNG